MLPDKYILQNNKEDKQYLVNWLTNKTQRSNLRTGDSNYYIIVKNSNNLFNITAVSELYHDDKRLPLFTFNEWKAQIEEATAEWKVGEVLKEEFLKTCVSYFTPNNTAEKYTTPRCFSGNRTVKSVTSDGWAEISSTGRLWLAPKTQPAHLFLDEQVTPENIFTGMKVKPGKAWDEYINRNQMIPFCTITILDLTPPAKTCQIKRQDNLLQWVYLKDLLVFHEPTNTISQIKTTKNEQQINSSKANICTITPTYRIGSKPRGYIISGRTGPFIVKVGCISNKTCSI